jgi:hypothetical protein
MSKNQPGNRLFKPYIAIPQDHGSWVFLLSPLLIGLFAGGKISAATPFLVTGALAAFFLRQPVTIAVKALSGRRARADLKPALFWGGLYGLIGLACLAALALLGYAYILLLALPAVPVFAWHLWLVSKRSERRQAGVEILGSGVLALAAPAAYWVGVGSPDPDGWWLWALVWFQSAASIVYAYLRLGQRELEAVPPVRERLRLGWRALAYTGFNFVIVLALSLLKVLPPLLWLPYLIQLGETIYGTLRPAVKVKPTTIGIRQLIVSSIFTVVFILTWTVNP